jgi:broad specificity phosphatase PhoE
MPPRFTFVRHAEAEHNVAFREKKDESVFQDEQYKDAVLTAKGFEQAKETATALSSLKIIDIWCSPLTRCLQTADEIFEETSAQTIYLHDNLLERLGGGHVCNSRKSKTEIKRIEYCTYNTKYLAETPVTWIERENEYALRQRMFMLIILLADIYKDCSTDSHIVIVSHADAICSLTGKSLKNAEYTSMTYEEIQAL